MPLFFIGFKNGAYYSSPASSLDASFLVAFFFAGAFLAAGAFFAAAFPLALAGAFLAAFGFGRFLSATCSAAFSAFSAAMSAFWQPFDLRLPVVHS